MLSLAACGDTPPPTPAPVLDAATMQQLLDRLDRLAVALEAVPRTSAALAIPVPAAADRTPVADATTELTARIDALERELAAMRRSMGSGFAAARVTAIPPMQTQSLQQVNEQLSSKEQTVLQDARRSLFLLTQQQLLERFGMPSDVSVSSQGVHWNWADDNKRYLSATLVDGIAVRIW